MEAKKKTVNGSEFTEDETKLIRKAAWATWQYIGADALRDVEGGSISRSEVIELVCDAGRLGETLSGRFYERPDLAKRFSTIGWSAMVKLVKPAFPFTRYGM